MPDRREILLCGGAVVEGITRAIDRGGDNIVVTTENFGTVSIRKKNISKIDVPIESEEPE